jgi:aminoglycoside phosphotransferase family enzyme
MILVGREASLADKVRALRLPASYATPCDAIAAIETHFAWVFLAGDYAYKLKKPVQVERMDFRDLDARERSCREEVRLNRRLAAEIYLAVSRLCMDDAGQLHIDGAGVVVEWLVKMRRLPADRFLDRALQAGSVTATQIEPVANKLCEFYREQAPAPLSGADYLARLHAHVDDTREQLLGADWHNDGIELASERQTAFLMQHAALIQARALAGRIVEGHGDLRPEHIFLGSAQLQPCIIDCLEFDRDLRILDPLEELAFLSLECARIGAAWVGAEFVRVYRQTTTDEFDERLFSFYRAARSLNRAKIAAWHLRDPEVRDLADWRALADSYVNDALLPPP